MKIRFTHPLNGTSTELELASDVTFADMQRKLYKAGFLEPKRGGYNYTVNGNLCAKNRTLASYVAEPMPDTVEVNVSGLLTILI